MNAPVTIYPLATSKIYVGGVAEVAVFGDVAGGVITNPRSATDQGLPAVEVLFVDPTGKPAALEQTETTIKLQAGESYFIPAGQTTSISVNASSTGHLFAGYIVQPQTPYPPTPQTGTFPPSGPTTLTQTLPSYLYQEYNDDQNLQGFIAAYNTLAQIYVTWFATVLLPVYTNPMVVGSLLDWVAEGLYGMTRPALGSGLNRTIGPLNTYPYNTLPLNVRKLIGPSDVTVTSDDIFKRIMTWNFYKGDGNQFSIRWLKRRVVRFLIGVNGTAPNIDQTYDVSVTIGPGIIAIAITVGTRSVTGGAIYNRFGFNRMAYNRLVTQFNPAPVQYPAEPIFKEAVEAGVLQFPLQYEIAVSI